MSDGAVRVTSFYTSALCLWLVGVIAYGWWRTFHQDLTVYRCADACFPEPVKVCLQTRAACESGRVVELFDE